jgi:hypothetical protein
MSVAMSCKTGTLGTSPKSLGQSNRPHLTRRCEVNDELTEEELKVIEADAEKYHSGVENTFYHGQVLRLVDEVRRLQNIIYYWNNGETD